MWVSPASAQDEPVVVVDLSGGSADQYDRLKGQLASVRGLALHGDDDLSAALRGVGPAVDTLGSASAANKADKLAAAGNCADARTEAQRAAVLWASSQAGGADAKGALAALHLIMLRCADKAGDVDGAMAAAATLRRLAQPIPTADAPLLARYPALDASANVALAEVVVESGTAGDAVYLDYERVGVTPITLHVSQGAHVLAVGRGAAASARRIDVSKWRQTETLSPAQTASRWSAVEQRVRDLRAGKEAPGGPAIGALLADVGVRFGVVIGTKGGVEVWARKPTWKLSRLVGSAASGVAAGKLILDQISAWRGPGIDPDRPLLRESDVPSRTDRRKGKTKWWVYASVAGAVAVAAGIILISSSGDDRQRIEVSFP